jgi:hypothetical protein
MVAASTFALVRSARMYLDLILIPAEERDDFPSTSTQTDQPHSFTMRAASVS